MPGYIENQTRLTRLYGELRTIFDGDDTSIDAVHNCLKRELEKTAVDCNQELKQEKILAFYARLVQLSRDVKQQNLTEAEFRNQLKNLHWDMYIELGWIAAEASLSIVTLAIMTCYHTPAVGMATTAGTFIGGPVGGFIGGTATWITLASAELRLLILSLDRTITFIDGLREISNHKQATAAMQTALIQHNLFSPHPNKNTSLTELAKPTNVIRTL